MGWRDRCSDLPIWFALGRKCWDNFGRKLENCLQRCLFWAMHWRWFSGCSCINFILSFTTLRCKLSEEHFFAWRNLKIMQLTRLSKGDAWSLSYQWGCGCLNKQTAYIFADQLTFTYFHLRSLAWARSLPRWSMTRQMVWQTWCTNKSPTVSFGKCPISPPKAVGKICFAFGFLLPDFPLPARLALPSSKWFRRRPYKIRFFSDLVMQTLT